MEGKNMATKEIWVVEVNLDSVDPFEYRVIESDKIILPPIVLDTDLG